MTELANQIEALSAAATPGKHHAFQSTLEPDRWYVSNGSTAILATEIGASGHDQAALTALLFNAVPQIIAALNAQAEVEALRVAAQGVMPVLDGFPMFGHIAQQRIEALRKALGDKP